MGVEFDFKINVTDCLAGFSLFQWSLTVCRVCCCTFSSSFILLSILPHPSHAAFVCSWITAHCGAEQPGSMDVDGSEKNGGSSCLICCCWWVFFFPFPHNANFFHFPVSLTAHSVAVVRRKVVAIEMRRRPIQSSLTGNKIQACPTQCPSPQTITYRYYLNSHNSPLCTNCRRSLHMLSVHLRHNT